MADYSGIINDLEQKLRLPHGLLASVVQHESGGDPNARSPAGAVGLTQLMPATARELGVDPSDPVQNLTGGARYLRQQLDSFHGSVPLALAAYNAGPGAVSRYGGIPPFAETQRYVRNVLAGMPPAAAGAEATAASASLPPLPAPTAQPPAGGGLLPILNANNRLLGLPPLPQIRVPGRARTGAVPTTTGDAAATPRAPRTPQARTVSNVTLADGADRQGAATHPQVLGFLSTVAAVYGQPLTVGTGTNHNRYVKGTRRESAHWTGWAADVPASGDALTKLGYSALLAAGMNPRQATRAAAKGGLFNIGGVQIIFKTNIGGNHWQHLHVGLRPERQRA